jgi:hypothetical protein
MNPSCTSTLHLVLWLSKNNNNRGICDLEKVVTFAKFDQMVTSQTGKKEVQRGILRNQSNYSNEFYGKNIHLKQRHYWQSHANSFYERQANIALKNHEILMKAKRLNRFWISRCLENGDDEDVETVHALTFSINNT